MVVDLLVIGLGITLEPFPLTAFILILSAEKGTRKGLAFILGWLACLVVVIAAVILMTRGNPPASNTAPSTAALAVKLVLGILLILLAVRQWRRRGRRGRPRNPPSLDGAAGSTLVLGRRRARRLPSALGAGRGRRRDGHPGQALHRRGLPDADAVLPAGHVQFPVPGAVRGLPPAAAGARLKALRTWLDTHRDQVIIVMSLLLGFWLAGKSIYLLVG